MIGLVVLVLTGLAGVSWWRLTKAREQARQVAAITCREHGLVLMDDTVVLDRIRLKKYESGRRSWVLLYRFAFAQQGILHLGGSVMIEAGSAPTVVIRTRSGQLIEEVGS